MSREEIVAGLAVEKTRNIMSIITTGAISMQRVATFAAAETKAGVGADVRAVVVVRERDIIIIVVERVLEADTPPVPGEVDG